MIRSIRNSKFLRFFYGLMAIYFLNISVDTADPEGKHLAEDLSFNDQESLVEIFVEKVLGYEDAFEEYDDNDIEEHHFQKLDLKLKLFCLDLSIIKTASDPLKRAFPESKDEFSNFRDSLDPPPPKV